MVGPTATRYVGTTVLRIRAQDAGESLSALSIRIQQIDAFCVGTEHHRNHDKLIKETGSLP